MRSSNHLIASALALALAAPALAQEGELAAKDTAEIAQLQAMLERVDAALAALEPVVRPAMTFVQYDIRQLQYQLGDHFAPNLTIPSASAGFRSGAGGGSFAFEEADEGEGSVLDPDQLETLMTQAVGEDAWDDPASIEIHHGYLMVRQTPLAHARIKALLDGFKREQTRSIQLEVGFYILSPSLQRELEAAALGSKGSLTPATLAKLDRSVESGEAKLSGCAMLTALNHQRVYLHQGDERAFVSGFEQSSGGTGSIVRTVADPIVEVLRSGLALDVRATLSGQGKKTRVSLDVRFVRTRPQEMTKRKTPWGPIDMPRVAVDSVRTSARVPSGGGMLVFSARASQDNDQPDVTIIVRPLVTSQGN